MRLFAVQKLKLGLYLFFKSIYIHSKLHIGAIFLFQDGIRKLGTMMILKVNEGLGALNDLFI